ncbi:MAG: hypothetical protein V1809_07820, partial [Planctomycetota bacterium]
MEQRLENMERQLGRMRRFNRWLLVVVGLAVGGWWLLGVGGLRPIISIAQAGEGGNKEIRANQFIVEDENGKTRIVLGVVKGGPGLILFDEGGKPRATLFID